MIRLAESLQLPENAVTQTLACIGRKGAGKTYLASLIAEAMLNIRAQIVVIDPVGNWWGLRVASDGKSKGKDIYIAGGERGDVPILPDSGQRFARLVVEKGISMVLDVSSFRQNERKRFAADFAEEFFHLKKSQRSAVHLFVEEAQLFAPQRTGPDELRMLGAFENIIRLGRNYGIGATMISQRPQSINKEVLSQVECLCVLQVNGTHERKALEEWVQEAGADRKLVGELPGLGRGEGYVWSPAWLRVFQRVKFGEKTTFDASATPEVGKVTEAARVASMDIDALRSSLEDIVAKVQQNDPAFLRKRIAELERAASTTVNPRIEKELARITEELQTAHSKIQELQVMAGKDRDLARRLQGYVDALVKIQVAAEDLEPLKPLQEFHIDVTPLRLKPESLWPRPSEPAMKATLNGNLRLGARRMLAVLCQWFPSARTEAQLAAQVQMKRTGGTWAAYKSDLTKGGYVQIQNGMWYATEKGRAYLGSDIPETPATTEEVVNLWGPKLRKGAREMLDVLVSRRGHIVDRADLGKAVDMEPSGGTFAAYLSDLKQAGLIIVDRDGVRANAETLFL